MNFLSEFFDAALRLPPEELRKRDIADRPNEMALIAVLISPEQIEEWAKKKLIVQRTLTVPLDPVESAKKTSKEMVKLLIVVTNGERHTIELSCEKKDGMPIMSFKVNGKERPLPVTMISDCSRIIKEEIEGLLVPAA